MKFPWKSIQRKNFESKLFAELINLHQENKDKLPCIFNRLVKLLSINNKPSLINWRIIWQNIKLEKLGSIDSHVMLPYRSSKHEIIDVHHSYKAVYTLLGISNCLWTSAIKIRGIHSGKKPLRRVAIFRARKITRRLDWDLNLNLPLFGRLLYQLRSMQRYFSRLLTLFCRIE